jgi:hypothetical protein
MFFIAWLLVWTAGRHFPAPRDIEKAGRRNDVLHHFLPPVFLSDSFLPPPVFSFQAQLAGLAPFDSGAQRDE